MPLHPVDKSKHYMVFLVDILGFESKFNEDGLRNIYSLYKELAVYIDSLGGGAIFDAWPSGSGTATPFLGYVDIHHAYFSDTILLWSHYNPRAVRHFLANCNDLFCHSIRLGFMARGAISVGEAILDGEESVFLGAPLIEAARAEKSQHWIGVALCRSFAKASSGQPLPWEQLLFYEKHIKPDHARPELGWYSPQLVLNWPRSWRKQSSESLPCVIRSHNRDRTHSRYYERTLEFIDFSDAYGDWMERSDGPQTIYQAVTGKAPVIHDAVPNPAE